MKWLKQLFQPRTKTYRKYSRFLPVAEISSFTAYQRGIERGKQLEIKRIIAVLESQKEEPNIIGNPPSLDNLIGYLKFFLLK